MRDTSEHRARQQERRQDRRLVWIWLCVITASAVAAIGGAWFIERALLVTM
jgi:hypothetical protein